MFAAEGSVRFLLPRPELKLTAAALSAQVCNKQLQSFEQLLLDFVLLRVHSFNFDLSNIILKQQYSYLSKSFGDKSLILTYEKILKFVLYSLKNYFSYPFSYSLLKMYKFSSFVC